MDGSAPNEFVSRQPLSLATAPGGGGSADPAPRRADIETCNSITAIDRDEWDALATTALYRHGFLRVLEANSAEHRRPLYFVARGPRGLLGAIVARVQDRRHAGPTLDHALFNHGTPVARLFGAGSLPALLCGTQIGCEPPWLLDRDLAPGDALELRDRLVAHVAAYAAERRLSACFRNWPRELPDTGRGLDTPPLRTSELPAAILDVRWPDFKGYLRDLSQSHPSTHRNIGKDVRRGRREQLSIQPYDPRTDDAAELHALLDAHHRRRNRVPCPFGADFLPQLAASLGHAAIIRVARVRGRVAGVTLGLHDTRTAYLFAVGLEPARAHEARVYANLCYNHPIETLIASGCRQIQFGRMLYPLKVRRGCTLVDCDMVLFHRTRPWHHLLRPLLRLRAAWVDRRTATLPRRSAGEPSPPANRHPMLHG